jgi:hypothetical protein
MQHLNKEVEGQLLRQPHVRIKLKVKLDNDNTKTFRLIKQCDLQLYEGVALSSNSESQTEEQSFEYDTK